MQQISNPVPRVVHPKWLTNKSNNTKINEIFQRTTKEKMLEDMENIGKKMFAKPPVPIVTVHKR